MTSDVTRLLYSASEGNRDALDDAPEATVALDSALTEFAELDPRNAKIVELRWFGGLSHEQIADLLDVSVRTVERGRRVSRAWLRQRLES